MTPKKLMEPYKASSGRSVRVRGRFSQSGGRGKPLQRFLFRVRPGLNMVPAESQAIIKKDPVVSSKKVNQSNMSCKHYCKSNSF